MFVDPTPQSSTRGLELHSHRSTHRSFTMEDHGKDPSHAIIVRTDLGIVYDDDLCRPSLSRHCVNRSFTVGDTTFIHSVGCPKRSAFCVAKRLANG